MAKAAHHFPACGTKDVVKILAAVGRLDRADQDPVDELGRALGAHELCRVLHAMRRWYSFQTGAMARILLAHRDELVGAMDLDDDAAVGCFRGFKVNAGDPLASLREGAVTTLPVTRNGGCSSWTAGRELADRFSGASRGKVGLVVELLHSPGAQPFIAPPERTRPWFDALYQEAIGSSFRFNEREYAVRADAVQVRIVRVKRR